MLQAETDNRYIDHINKKAGFYYRLYCIHMECDPPEPEIFKANALKRNAVEKTEWAYFKTEEVLNGKVDFDYC